MPKFAHKGRHIDGVWFHVFQSENDVISDMREYVNRTSITENIQYVDDFGGTHIYFEIPESFSESKLEQIHLYWDAIETGEETTAFQRSLAEEYDKWELNRTSN